MTNTKNELIAQRYSDSLVELAKEGKLTFTKIEENLDTISEILIQSPDLMEILTNPVVSIENKKEIIEGVFAESIDKLTLNLLKVIVDKNRFVIFSDIVTAFKKSLDAINNISRVEVISATEMNEELKKKLQTKLEQKLSKKVILDVSTNSEIIAGLVIKIGDNVIDTSLKHKLEKLGRTITK